MNRSMHMAYSASYQSLLPTTASSVSSPPPNGPVRSVSIQPQGPTLSPIPRRLFNGSTNFNDNQIPRRLLNGSTSFNDSQRSTASSQRSFWKPPPPPPKVRFLCSRLEVINAKYIVAYFELFIGVIALIDQTMGILKQKFDYDDYVRSRERRYRMGSVNPGSDEAAFEPTWAEIRLLKDNKTDVLLKIVEELVVILSVIAFHLSACIVLIIGLNLRKRTFEIYYLVISGILVVVFFAGGGFLIYVIYIEQKNDFFDYGYAHYQTLISVVCVCVYVMLRIYFIQVICRHNPPKQPANVTTTAPPTVTTTGDTLATTVVRENSAMSHTSSMLSTCVESTV